MQVLCENEDGHCGADAPAAEVVSAESQRAFHARMLGTALKTDTRVADFYLEEAGGDPRLAVALHSASPPPPYSPACFLCSAALVCCPGCVPVSLKTRGHAVLPTRAPRLALHKLLQIIGSRAGQDEAWEWSREGQELLRVHEREKCAQACSSWGCGVGMLASAWRRYSRGRHYVHA